MVEGLTVSVVLPDALTLEDPLADPESLGLARAELLHETERVSLVGLGLAVFSVEPDCAPVAVAQVAVGVTEVERTELIVWVRVSRRVRVDVLVTRSTVGDTLVETLLDRPGVTLTLVDSEEVFEFVVLSLIVDVVRRDCEIRAEEVPRGVPVVVFDELSEAVWVTEDVDVRVFAEDAVKEEEEVLVDVGLGSRVTEEVPVEFAVDEADPVTVGQEVGEAVCLHVRVSEGEPRVLRDPVTELVLVLDIVEDAECVVVGVSDRDLLGVSVDVLEEVVVAVTVLVRVLLGDELELRVGGRDRVPVRVTLILGLPVEVADCVLVPGADLLTVGVPVDVLDGGEERVREGEPVVVFVPPMDFVADRVTGMVIDPLDVFVVQGDAVLVFDLAAEKLMLGEAVFDLDPRGVTESVGEEEDVLEDVPEGEDVLVEEIVFVEVEVPVRVRVL